MARSGGGRPTVEDSITLSIRHLTQAGFVPHGRQSGTLQWTRTNSQQPVCRAEYDVTLDEDSGILHLANTTSLDPFGRAVRLEGQVIQLVSTPLPYGGRRWWFLCLDSGQRVLKLHLPYGAKGFASRQAYRLGYAVQRQSARDKAYRRARKARDRIGGSPNLCERLPFKPKWMRWATYWRHVDACQRAERQTLRFLAASA